MRLLCSHAASWPAARQRPLLQLRLELRLQSRILQGALLARRFLAGEQFVQAARFVAVNPLLNGGAGSSHQGGNVLVRMPTGRGQLHGLNAITLPQVDGGFERAAAVPPAAPRR